MNLLKSSSSFTKKKTFESQSEMMPIAKRNTAAAASMARKISSWQVPAHVNLDGDDEIPCATRRKLGAQFTGEDAIQYNTCGIELGYSFAGSDIIIPDGTDPVADGIDVYVPNTRPGARAPHAWVSEDQSIIDVFYQHGFSLLDFSSPPDEDLHSLWKAEAKSLGVPMKFFCNHQLGNSARQLYETRFVLIRPDMHVLWRSNEPPRNLCQILTVARG